ncbi:MAG: HD domain-containing protein [Elusimicrobia bacterium]|nr:HD domain-containing protein [Elusimicrobiota bacterium]
MTSSIPAEILKLFNEAYIVGGAVRDAVLKRPVKDLDLAVPGRAGFPARAKRLARRLGASVFPLDEENLVYRLTPRSKPGLNIDIAPFQGKDIKEDLLRRDFTINAMALPLAAGFKMAPDRKTGLFTLPAVKKSALLDPAGGLRDIAAGTVRMTSREALAEDPLRLLRAFRCAAELDFKIDKKTLDAIKRRAASINKAAPERIHDELLLLLNCAESHAWLKALYEAGLLTAIIPELAAQSACAEVYYGKGGVLKHTFAVVERLDHLFENTGTYIPGWRKIAEFLEEKNVLKLAGLLHDVAKPARAGMINGRLRFFGHEEYGAIMSSRLMERLRFSKDHIRLVSKLIGQHLRPGNLASNDLISDRAMFRFFRAMGEYAVPLLVLSWADHASYITQAQLRSIKNKIKEKPFPIPKGGLPQNGIKKTLRFLEVLNLLFEVYISKNIKLKTARLIDGHDVLRTLKMKEGPAIGEILEKVSLRQFEGKINTRRQALNYLKSCNFPGSRFNGFPPNSPADPPPAETVQRLKKV